MDTLGEIYEALQKGRAKLVSELVQRALDEGCTPQQILDEGLLGAMDVIAEKFKNNEVFVPEVLIAARAMNAGTALLKPHLAESGAHAIGKAIIGTVKGDLHDIGKNLVRMMMEGKGIEIVDLGVDVSAEQFLAAYHEHSPQLVVCSALLTTTMQEIKTVVEIFEQNGLRDKVTIMIGGAPVTESFREAVGADIYTPDAATAAEAAKRALAG